MPIPLLRCPCWDFQIVIRSVSYGKDGVCCRDENVWFSILLDAHQAFWRDIQLQQVKPYLTFIGSKPTIITLEQDIKTCLKLKLKNKSTRTTLSNGVLLSWVLTLNVFLTWIYCFYCWFWTSKWRMVMLRVHFNDRYTSDHQKVWQGRVCFYSSLPEYSEQSYKSISGISKKKISLKLSSSK